MTGILQRMKAAFIDTFIRELVGVHTPKTVEDDILNSLSFWGSGTIPKTGLHAGYEDERLLPVFENLESQKMIRLVPDRDDGKTPNSQRDVYHQSYEIYS